jgi:type II secretory pathway pseudopilin PulG
MSRCSSASKETVMSTCPTQKCSAFCLVELAVVLFVAATLLGLVLSTVRSAQVAAADKQTMIKIKGVNLALHAFNDAYRRLPPAFDKFMEVKNPNSVHIYLLPYIDEVKLHNTFIRGEGKGNPKATVEAFISPIDPSIANRDKDGIQNFAANLRVFSDSGVKTKYNENMAALKMVEPGTAAMPRTFSDGASNTISLVTKYAYCGKEGGSRYASAPNTKFAAFFGQNAATAKAHPCDPKAIYQLNPDGKQCLTTPLMGQSFTNKGLQIGMFDGSARTVSPDLSAETWNRAVQPNDELPLGKDWD